MSEQKEIICTNCPMGCHVQVVLENGEITSVTGNTCPRGEQYARAEVTHPVRTVTTTVALEGGGVLPVRSDRAVSKKELAEYLDTIHAIRAARPVAIGDILLENIDGEGANIIATANA